MYIFIHRHIKELKGISKDISLINKCIDTLGSPDEFMVMQINDNKYKFGDRALDEYIIYEEDNGFYTNTHIMELTYIYIDKHVTPNLMGLWYAIEDLVDEDDLSKKMKSKFKDFCNMKHLFNSPDIDMLIRDIDYKVAVPQMVAYLHMKHKDKKKG